MIRYEVNNILTTGISFGLDCASMECGNFTGSLKVGRLYPDAHMGWNSTDNNGRIKYKLNISGKPSEMLGLYYIHLQYNEGRKK